MASFFEPDSARSGRAGALSEQNAIAFAATSAHLLLIPYHDATVLGGTRCKHEAGER